MAPHVLITGAAGFIGSTLSARLLASGYRSRTRCFYRRLPGSAKGTERVTLAADANYRLVRGIFGTGNWSVPLGHLRLMWLCTWPHWPVCGVTQNPDAYTDVNVTGTVRVLEQMRRRGLSRLVFASSSSVYGTARCPFRESDNVDLSASPYAATKRAGELLCATWHHLYGIQSTCLRFFTVYGPRQRPDMAIHKFMRRVRAGEPVPMFGDGASVRDYTYIDDIVDGVVAAIERPLGHCIINLGGGAPVSLRDLIQGVGTAVGVTPRIERLPTQAGDVPLTAADISTAQDCSTMLRAFRCTTASRVLSPGRHEP